MLFNFLKTNKKSMVEEAKSQRQEAFGSIDRANSKKSFSKNKKIIIAIVSLIAFLLVVGLIRAFFENSNKIDTEKLSNAYEKQKEEYKAPPPLEKKYGIDEAKLNALKDSSKENTQEASQADKSTQEASQAYQEAKIMYEEKKPENMVEFLKKEMGNMEFQRKYLSFIFQQQRYVRGDSFKGWWKIEEITPNYIRFFDDNEKYSYNLRFVDWLDFAMKVSIGSETFELLNTALLSKEEIEKAVHSLLTTKNAKEKEEVVLMSETNREHFYFGSEETYYFYSSGLMKKYPTLF